MAGRLGSAGGVMGLREWADAEYSRIYWTIADDKKFAEVFDDDRRWAAYTRLLMAAEQAYPSAAPLPRWLADDVLEYLVSARIIAIVRGSSYRVVGLQSEREGRLQGNAIGGKKRSDQAERDEFGRFRPAPGAGPASQPAPGTLDASDTPAPKPARPAKASVSASVSASVKPAGSPADSQPIQLRRDEDEDETRDETRILSTEVTSRARSDRPDVQALRDRGWKRVSAKQRAVLDEVLDRHDVTGSAFAAEVIRATPRDRDPLQAVMAADRMWQASERAKAEAEELAADESRAKERAEAAEVKNGSGPMADFMRIFER